MVLRKQLFSIYLAGVRNARIGRTFMQAIYQLLIHRKYKLALKVLLLVTLMLLYRLPVSADGLSDSPVSLEASNQPLSLVLDRLSQISGKRLIYDETWADANISVKIVNQDLDKALRKIFSNYNYAIIYADDGNIRIMIYGEKDAADSETADNRPPVEYGHVGSAEIEPEETAQENEIETDASDDAETDREAEPEEDQKGIADDSEAIAESTETDTQETVDNDVEKDDDQPRTLLTD